MFLKKISFLYCLTICFFLSITCTDPVQTEPTIAPEISAGNDTTVYILDTIQLSGVITNGVIPTTIT